MTDRELLELAAKATGIDLKPMQINNVREQGDGRFVGYMADPEQWSMGWFNPLVDDGDALRLAVKLGIDLVRLNLPTGVGISAYDGKAPSAFEKYTDDPYAATRRAIVRAAAEIGRQMENQRMTDKTGEPAPAVTCDHEWIRTGAMGDEEKRCIKCGEWGKK